MKYNPENHSFVVCAYKESPYLADCIRSLKNQSIKSSILVTTSTPNEYIESICKRENIPLLVNHSNPGIASDWQFALSSAKTDLVTLAHQDDIYKPEYTEKMLKKVNKAKHPVLYFCDYSELKNDKEVKHNKLLFIKRLLLIPLRMFPSLVFMRRLSLSFGCPICCPSVTYVSEIIKRHPFESSMKCDLDWEKWEELSKEKGKFVYNNRILMSHRIHSESATSLLIEDNTRSEEDFLMFERFWNEKTAKLLTKKYSSSQKSNSNF